MRTLVGSPYKIHTPIIGRLSDRPVSQKLHESTIIVNPEVLSYRQVKGYIACISNSEFLDSDLKKDGVPCIFGLPKDLNISNGDVVELMPDGRVHVLYDTKSRHNVLYVTSKCNNNCLMCPQPIEADTVNMTDRNLRLISLIGKNTVELAMTGGEPTMLGNDLLRLVLACKKMLPSTSLLILTNGRKFSDFAYAHVLSSIKHPKIIFGIPLYGDNNDEHDAIVGCKGAFNETISGIMNLAQFHHKIEIRTVLHKLTYRRLPRFAEFIYRNVTFVHHVAFMGLETMWRGRENLDLLWVEATDLLGPLEEAIHFLAKRKINVSVYNIPLCMLPKSLWQYARQSISDWKTSFHAKCVACKVNRNCSGVFGSGLNLYEKHLRPIA